MGKKRCKLSTLELKGKISSLQTSQTLQEQQKGEGAENKGILQTTLSQKFHNLDEMDQFLENYQVTKVTPNQSFGDSLVYPFSYKSLIPSPFPSQTILIERRIGILFKNLRQLRLLQKNFKECLISLSSQDPLSPLPSNTFSAGFVYFVFVHIQKESKHLPAALSMVKPSIKGFYSSSNTTPQFNQFSVACGLLCKLYFLLLKDQLRPQRH